MRVLYFSGVTPVHLSAGYSLMFRHLARMKEHEVLILTRDYARGRGMPLPHRAVMFPERSRTYSRIAARVGSPFFWIEREAARLRRLAAKYAREFLPDVVLTVWESPYLLAAAELARSMSTPLVVVFHDDYEQMLPLHSKRRSWALSRLAPIYRGASARICAGPGMVERLELLYGAAATEIVYPIPDEAPPFEPPARRRSPAAPVRVGFFGEMGGNHQVLLAVANVLAAANAELHVFSHSTGAERESLAARPGVYDHGSTDPQSLREFFRSEIDLTLVPQGFEPEHLDLRRSCFPSKLPEACQIGLPLLVVGPSEGSSFRWAAENLDEPAFLDSMESVRLGAAIRSFSDGATWEGQRQRLAVVARTTFSPSALHERFEKALLLGARTTTAQIGASS